MKIQNAIVVLLITALLSLVGNLVGCKISPIEALPGMLILVAIAFLGILLAKVIPGHIPNVAYIVTLGALLTIPGFPLAKEIGALTGKVNFLALTTPILAYAGIFSGKNVGSLKQTGWRIILVAFFVIIGTYLGSAVIAQGILMMLKQI